MGCQGWDTDLLQYTPAAPRHTDKVLEFPLQEKSYDFSGTSHGLMGI